MKRRYSSDRLYDFTRRLTVKKVKLSMPWSYIGGSPLIFNLGTSWRGVVNYTPRPLYPRERTFCPIEQEVGWSPEPVWMCWRREKSISSAGFRNPHLPASSLVTTDYVNSVPKKSTIFKIILSFALPYWINCRAGNAASSVVCFHYNWAWLMVLFCASPSSNHHGRHADCLRQQYSFRRCAV
jgi:hypothetical protein